MSISNCKKKTLISHYNKVDHESIYIYIYTFFVCKQIFTSTLISLNGNKEIKIRLNPYNFFEICLYKNNLVPRPKDQVHVRILIRLVFDNCDIVRGTLHAY